MLQEQISIIVKEDLVCALNPQHASSYDHSVAENWNSSIKERNEHALEKMRYFQMIGTLFERKMNAHVLASVQVQGHVQMQLQNLVRADVRMIVAVFSVVGRSRCVFRILMGRQNQRGEFLSVRVSAYHVKSDYLALF